MNLLGQWCSLHPFTSLCLPSHGLPPYCSTKKSRDLICIPPPHSWVQSPHSVHGNHSQSTGQCFRKHVWISWWSPSQSLPLYCGTGLVQLRVLVSVPLSHVVLHSLHLVHFVQPPWTAEQQKQMTLNYTHYKMHYMCVCLILIVVGSLGQWCVLQSLMSTVSPVQSSSRAPTVIHCLILLWRPPPQDKLHSVQLLHALHVLGGGAVTSGSLPFSSSGPVNGRVLRYSAETKFKFATMMMKH